MRAFAMTPEDLEQRLAGIASRWTAASRATLMASTGWRESWKPPDAGFLLAIYATLALVPLELAAWGLQGVLEGVLPINLEQLGAIPALAVLAGLLVLWLINGWLVDRALERACRRRASSRWQRACRFLQGGVPLLGFYVIPKWHHHRKPEEGAGAPLLDLSSRRRTGDNASSLWGLRWSRSVEASIVSALWLIAPNVVFLFFVSTWIAAPSPAGPPSPWALWAAIVVAHAASFFGIRSYVTQQREWRPSDGGGRQLASLLPWAWLLPMPVPGICLLWVLSWSFQGGTSGTLTYGIFLRRRSISQLPAWAGLQEDLADRRQEKRWQWPWTRREVSISARGGEGEQRLTSLYRLKTLALASDGTLLGLTMIWLARRSPGVTEVLSRAWAWMNYAALLLAATGLLAALVIGVGLRVGPQGTARDKVSVTAGYVGLTHLSLLSGLWTGIYLEQGQHQEIGNLIYAMALLGVMVGCLWLAANVLWRKLWPSAPTPGDTLLWIGLLFALCILGVGLMMEPLDGQGIPAQVRTAALLSPLWNLALALLFLKDFLRPFGLREALRLRPRWRMAFLLLTLPAPLGGLAIPLWIWARHRWWPEWERSWSPGGAVRPPLQAAGVT